MSERTLPSPYAVPWSEFTRGSQVPRELQVESVVTSPGLMVGDSWTGVRIADGASGGVDAGDGD